MPVPDKNTGFGTFARAGLQMGSRCFSWRNGRKRLMIPVDQPNVRSWHLP